MADAISAVAAPAVQKITGHDSAEAAVKELRARVIGRIPACVIAVPSARTLIFAGV